MNYRSFKSDMESNNQTKSMHDASCTIQAAWNGYKARKILEDVVEEFQETFKRIEGKELPKEDNSKIGRYVKMSKRENSDENVGWMRHNEIFELLWVQQAIRERKHFLKKARKVMPDSS